MLRKRKRRGGKQRNGIGMEEVRPAGGMEEEKKEGGALAVHVSRTVGINLGPSWWLTETFQVRAVSGTPWMSQTFSSSQPCQAALACVRQSSSSDGPHGRASPPSYSCFCALGGELTDGMLNLAGMLRLQLVILSSAAGCCISASAGPI